MFESEEGQQAIKIILLGFVSGALGDLLRHDRQGTPVKIFRTITRACAAGLVAYLVGTAGKAMGLSFDWILVSAGVLSWMGAEVSMVVLEELVRKKFGLTKGDKTDGE